jgi:hypothetical protein
VVFVSLIHNRDCLFLTYVYLANDC